MVSSPGLYLRIESSHVMYRAAGVIVAESSPSHLLEVLVALQQELKHVLTTDVWAVHG